VSSTRVHDASITTSKEASRGPVSDELDHVFGDDPDLVDEDAPIIDSELDPAGSVPGGTAELVALAAHDANDLLRFIESAMTEAESEAFLAEVRARDPEGAGRLLRMREDQRLLRTSLELQPPTPDLLGPVRARLARGELVQVQSEIGAEAADPTEFMARSVATLARRRRRARRRPLAMAAIFGMIGIGVTAVLGPRLGREKPDGLESAASPSQPSATLSFATFGLVLPARDRVRIELAMSVVAASHGATLVRTAVSGEGEDDVAFPVPLVGSRGSAPADELRRELGIRGFDYAVVVDRDEVSMVLAEMGALAYPGPRGETSARLVPSSSDDPRAALDEDMWQSWSHQSEAAKGLPPGVRRLVVPIAVIESAD
jgi:hypothetical protein